MARWCGAFEAGRVWGTLATPVTHGISLLPPLTSPPPCGVISMLAVTYLQCYFLGVSLGPLSQTVGPLSGSFPPRALGTLSYTQGTRNH